MWLRRVCSAPWWQREKAATLSLLTSPVFAGVGSVPGSGRGYLRAAGRVSVAENARVRQGGKPLKRDLRKTRTIIFVEEKNMRL